MNTAAFRTEVHEQLARIGQADIIVGIHGFNHAPLRILFSHGASRATESHITLKCILLLPARAYRYNQQYTTHFINWKYP